MAINGDLILVYKDGTKVAGVKSQEIQTVAETIEVANPTSGTWKRYVSKRKEWSLNVNYLVAAVSNITDVLAVGNTYTIVVRDRSNSATLTGSAILVTCKQTYTRGNLVAGSFQFQGSGALQ